jgi:hypothetical protein
VSNGGRRAFKFVLVLFAASVLSAIIGFIMLFAK